jgi:hypothetical protein
LTYRDHASEVDTRPNTFGRKNEVPKM